MLSLPQEFLHKMAGLLGEDYPAFAASLAGTSCQGLRINTLRVSVGDFLSLSPWDLTPIPWCSTGFYYRESDRPGKHIYHFAGMYYIQEPSAMAVAEYVAPQPGEWVLDLAAAPGGKTTHLAALMGGKGLIVANEVHRGRAQVLAQNVERLGIPNVIVTNEQPQRLAQYFPRQFDRVLVDAPCSGEGMFRKNPAARGEWSPAHAFSCAERQLRILESVPGLLRPGGWFVYSTCTFSPEENEGVVSRFLAEHPDFYVEHAPRGSGVEPGRPDWVAGPEELARTVRFWPHRLAGEGHFIAVLRRREGTEPRRPSSEADRAKDYLDYRSVIENILSRVPQGRPVKVGHQLYLMPADTPELAGLKVIWPGLHVGTFKKDRFEPAHGLSRILRAEDVRRVVDFPCDAPQLARYLRGEALPWDGPDGWYLVAVNGFGLGWAKLVKGVLKNHLPKGLRQTSQY
ncbi:MAG: hypothetical protein GX195_09425 [Firmicutes bacterium]|nr:hypothetical protein [Bacillota bacterium]